MELKTEKGMVGFFDVLGYQSIIDNNKMSDAARILSESFTRIPERVEKKLVEGLKEEASKEVYGKIRNRTNFMIISDSIVMTSSLGEIRSGLEKKTNTVQLLFFFLSASLLLHMSFDEGFPLRGAIDYGEFYV